MLRNRIYYGIKPFVPRTLRVAVRRWVAQRTRRTVKDLWPILPGSERPPAGWPGWPGGKQFAFVLTHDVEGSLGVSRCRAMMKLEQQFGFRSSFNFVPEGGYEVPPRLREEIVRSGFEVGVHDLHHDGKLYSNRHGFTRNAERINHYLKEWGAVGFRSGFMFHNLEWAHELNVLYEASTFDTDPFEPQPDGLGTIFPLWVPHPSSADNRGYVELPYTLVQDSTLFFLLREQSPDIWLRKLDWVAQHGGMALVNVHPDYVCFEPATRNRHEFPFTYYEELLRHVKNKYEAVCWHALPREVAEFVKKTRAAEHAGGPQTTSGQPAAARGLPTT